MTKSIHLPKDFMEIQSQTQETDIVVRKKGDIYQLYAPRHNCFANDKNLDQAFEKLTQEINNQEEKKIDAGFDDKKNLTLLSYSRNRNLLEEMGIFLAKALSMGIVVFFAILGSFLIIQNQTRSAITTKIVGLNRSIVQKIENLPDSRKEELHQSFQDLAKTLKPFLDDFSLPSETKDK